MSERCLPGAATLKRGSWMAVVSVVALCLGACAREEALTSPPGAGSQDRRCIAIQETEQTAGPSTRAVTWSTTLRDKENLALGAIHFDFATASTADGVFVAHDFCWTTTDVSKDLAIDVTARWLRLYDAAGASPQGMLAVSITVLGPVFITGDKPRQLQTSDYPSDHIEVMIELTGEPKIREESGLDGFGIQRRDGSWSLITNTPGVLKVTPIEL